MSDVSESELISAYLDGELTAEEHVRAEQMLAASAEARQLLEELRALGGTLQSLPQEKLDEDLGPRVLQIAERRMLSPDESNVSGTLRVPTADGTRGVPDTKPSAGRAAASLTSRGDDSPPSDGFPWRELSWRGMLSPRALIWSAIVVVVAVVIRFNSPPQNVNREQARLDKDKPVAAAGDKLAEKRKKANVEESWQGPADLPKKPAPAVLAERDAKKDANKNGESDDRRESIAKSEIAPAADKAAEGIRDHDELEPRKGERREFSMKAMQPAPAKEEVARERVAKESPRDESKAGPTAHAMSLPSEKPAAEPAVSSGEKLPAGNIAAHGAVESQNRLMQREIVQSKAAGEQKSGDGVVAGKDMGKETVELGRGEGGVVGGGFGGGAGRGGRLAVQKKLDQSKAIAANEQPASAPVAPVAAPAAAAAPMAAPALTVPLQLGQEAASPDVVVDKKSGGQAVTVINFNCSVAAARNGTFDKLLSENGIAATTSLGNYGQQSFARYQNFRADNGSLSPGGVQMPLGGTASLGSTGRQQQVVQQQSLNYNQAQREVAENSASRGASQTRNTQPATVAQSKGTAATDNSRNNSLSGSNSYGVNSYTPGANGPAVLNGGTQSAMADNTANGFNTTQQAGVANQNNYNAQGPAKSANVSNLNMALGTSPSTITYEVDASPEQLASLIKQVRQDRVAFSLPDAPPALAQELQKADRRSVGGGGFGGYNYQLKDQVAGGGGQAQSDAAGRAPLQNARGKQGQVDAETDLAYKLHEQNLNSQPGAAPAGAAKFQPAPATAPQQPASAAKTRIVFVLTVVDGVASPSAASQPAPAAPPAPAKGKQ